MVNVLQFGSVEVAAGTVGRKLLHSTSAAMGCLETPATVGHGLTAAAWDLYRRSAGEAAKAAHPPRQRQGSVVELFRGGSAKTIEALGGRLPPERALQSVALTIVVRSSGPSIAPGFAPAQDKLELCR